MYKLLINETMNFRCRDIDATEAVIDSVFYADYLNSWKMTWVGTKGDPVTVKSEGEFCIVDFYNLKKKVKSEIPNHGTCKQDVMRICK